MESDFHKVVQLSADIFLSSAELTKNQTLSLLTEPFQRSISSYESLSAIVKSNNGVLPLNSKAQSKELRYFAKDLATVLQIMGRLSELHLKEPYVSLIFFILTSLTSFCSSLGCQTVNQSLKLCSVYRLSESPGALYNAQQIVRSKSS